MYVCMYSKMLCIYFSIIISLYRGFWKNTSLYRGFIAQNFFVIAIEHFCMKNVAIKRFFQGTQLNIRYIEFFVITKFVISKFHCIIILAQTPRQGLGRFLSCGARNPEQAYMNLWLLWTPNHHPFSWHINTLVVFLIKKRAEKDLRDVFFFWENSKLSSKKIEVKFSKPINKLMRQAFEN